MHGLWFQLNAPAKTPHLAFSADLPPLSKTPLPFRPDEIYLWALSEAVASFISKKQTFVPSCNVAQTISVSGQGDVLSSHYESTFHRNLLFTF